MSRSALGLLVALLLLPIAAAAEGPPGAVPASPGAADTAPRAADPMVALRAELQREFDSKIIGLRDVLTTRFEANDKAVLVLSEGVNRVPTLLDREIKRLQDLTEEKFSGVSLRFDGVALQFKERDVRDEQARGAAGAAVEKALGAQDRAANQLATSGATALDKSQSAITKQIEGIQTNTTTSLGALTSQINDLKSRLDRSEGVGLGAVSTRTDSRADTGTLLAGAAVLVSLIGLAVVLFKQKRDAS